MRARLGLPEWTATPNPHAPEPEAGPEGGAGKGDDGGKGGGEWKPPASQADLDRIITDRLNREVRSKYAGLTPEQVADLKTKAEQFTALEAASRTDQERAVEDAKAAARREVLAEATPRVVRAEFRAAAKGVLTTEQTTALLEDLDLSKFINDRGEVDEDRIAKKVAALAPAGSGQQQQRRTPDLGQGHRDSVQPAGRDAGRAEAERRFGKTTK